MTLARSPRLRLFTLCALYLVQGIPTGFVTVTLAALLAERGYSAGAIALLMAVTYVPWALKVVYGPVLDRYQDAPMGRRRPWLLIAQTGMLAALGVLFSLEGVSAGLVLIGIIVFVYNLFGALQDVATDALAVDLLDEDERGFVNGAMWSSKIAGIAIGGAGMSFLLEHLGWRPAIGVQVVLLFGAALIALLVRERADDERFTWPLVEAGAAPGEDREDRQRLRDIVQAAVDLFRERRPAVLGLLALLASVPTRMMVTYGPIFTVQVLGWTDAGYAQFAGGTALAAGAAGALAGGYIADRGGRSRVVWGSLLTILAAFLLLALLQPWWSLSAVIIVFFLVGIFFDMALRMALQAAYMTVAEGEVAATQFTIYMTLGNMSNVIGSALVAPLDWLFRPQLIFVCAGLITFIPLGLLWWYRHAGATAEGDRALA